MSKMNSFSVLVKSTNKLVAPKFMAVKTNYCTANEAEFQTKSYYVYRCSRHPLVYPILQDFKLHKLDSGPSTKVRVSRDDALKLYRQLALVRKLDTAAATLYTEKAARGFCHLYTGQEAVAVGMRAAMRPVDTLITSYRCHAWTYLMGASAVGVLAELTGRKSGVSLGKGGSMHMYAGNFYGGNGIIGAQIPLGAGLALAHQYKGDGGVGFALCGDGAINQGQVFETFNMAKLWNLPIVFICENNGYAMGTSVSRGSASTEYYTRGDYVPGIWVDGMDVLACREVTKYCIDHCTTGKGPILLEMATYRYCGHSMVDPGTSYRTREEVDQVRRTRDPINCFKEKIVSTKLVSQDELKEIDQEVHKEIDEAIQVARTDSEVSLEHLTADVYSHNLEPYVRGILPAHQHKHINFGKPKNM